MNIPRRRRQLVDHRKVSQEEAYLDPLVTNLINNNKLKIYPFKQSNCKDGVMQMVEIIPQKSTNCN